jgi:hypothetical protein
VPFVTLKHPLPCLLWVISCRGAVKVGCPLYPQKRTLLGATPMSALCQKQTFCTAAEAELFDHLVGAGAGSPRPPRCRHDMLIQPQEANLVTYNVGLCRMVNGNLDAPYEGASIEAANIPDALLKAKKWAASVEVADNSWLQILLDGRSVRSLKPGSF